MLTTKLIVLREVTGKNIEERLESANKALEKNNRELNQFAYIVSHDLKAPLRAISNLSVWLQEDLGPTLSVENKKNLDMLGGRVARLEALINGILEYSKLGREKIKTERVELFEVIEEAIELVGCPSHINISVNEHMPVLEAPRILLIQVFSNLLSNAIKYNDKKEGVIRIYASETLNEYEITVEDNGPGIPAEFCEKIFVIFQTLQSRDKFESTGIGLAIVKRIVEEHGGKIWVESEIEKSSKFIFTWPKLKVDQDTK
jgi:signal transduction histidine kinase